MAQGAVKYLVGQHAHRLLWLERLDPGGGVIKVPAVYPRSYHLIGLDLVQMHKEIAIKRMLQQQLNLCPL